MIKQLLGGKAILYIVFFCILILFKTRIEILFNSILVVPILQYCKFSPFNDAVIFCCLALVFSYFIKLFLSNYIVSRKFLLLLVIISCIYLYYRFVNPIWNYTPFYFFRKAYYSDVLFFIIPALYFLLVLRNYYSRNISKSNSLNSFDSFNTDTPLKTDEIDLLKRRPLAAQLARRIKATYSEEALAIGITGSWGTGKTSFMKMIKEKFDENETILIDFDPWKSSDSNLIIIDFFETLEDKLSIYSAKVSAKIHSYTNAFIQVDDNIFTKIVKGFVHLFVEETSLGKKYQELNKSIKEIKKQIIIFIDDVDRLDKNEVKEVLKLIRNTANFSNTVFIVAYDKNYITASIKEINESNVEYFLEKIFQLEVSLPYYDKYVITKSIFEKLKEKIDSKYHQHIDEIIFKREISNSINISNYFFNIRDVIRFSNSFSLVFNLKEVAGEIDITDSFYIELLKLKFPSIFDLLKYKKLDFIDLNKNTSTPFYVLKSKNNDILIHTYIKQNSSSLNVSPANFDLVFHLLNLLFPTEYFRVHNRLSIVQPSDYHKYFTNHLLENELSENEFLEFSQAPLTELITQIDKWIDEGKRYNLLIRFREVRNFNSKEEFEKIIRAIFYFANKIDIKGSHYQPRYDNEDLYNKLYDDEDKRLIINKFYNKDEQAYKGFLIAIFNTAKTPAIFESDFIRFVRAKPYRSLIISDNELEEILVKYFDDCINTINSFSADLFWDFYHATYIKVDGQKIINQKVKDLIKQFAKEDQHGFLQITIDQNFRGDTKYYRISEFVLDIFQDYAVFESFIQTFATATYLVEYLDFYIKNKAYNYEYMEYKFQYYKFRK
ncbi:MAG: hypothetical protein COW65_05745 [Cytophagales bacterium CG18_big_fil_WC_8_21_14_2_50_42_9]|nr:MAG: hypothetical protein COW65_05745 [Cytophagales bacterium CG18_big_fil_WC_8_21_14_2_50_42_9]